ncbi:uncharacterized protein LOC113328844 [Papaver somniferum]|uniref:uncharacterized protein LOC113328844 n=1 Tax=Papaver somniferum TaxID=3469 RepID=UPI000E701171|nr:uncharacterized protein LOC113328844 [Papaver somniferum]
MVIALNSIVSRKAPGPDGFPSHFFKYSWSIVGDDMVACIQNFFTKSKLLKEVNNTFITLIAKNKNPPTVSDFRPISCCNVLYKCITKIISLRMKRILWGLISHNQSAFIPGRSIQVNIMLAHELVRNFHKLNGSPRCALKIDLRKAYDIVKWSVIFHVLKQLGFPDVFINWISLCITSAKFSVLVNGSPYGFFGATRGLRQGCPISPYLFVLAMEMLNVTLLRQVQLQNFGFHPRCNLTRLTHMCFADDVMLFFKGTTSAAYSIKVAFNEFSVCTGLEMNNQKTSLFHYEIEDVTLQQIITILDCSVGELPVIYLGILLLSTRLSYRDCLPLLEKVDDRLNSWKPKYLDYPRRALLIKFVLSGMLYFWFSCFILPERDCSWCWRRILEHRELAKQHIGTLLGDDNSSNFLYDNWHPKGRLVDWVDSNILETIGASDNTLVAEFISEDDWNFPSYMEDNVQEMVQQISTAYFNVPERDQIFWKPSITGQFSMKHTYIALSDHLPSPPWNYLVWFKKHIPRHSFISWLAFHRRLKTRSKLLGWGTISDASCILCGEAMETEDHLFHDCMFSSGIWNGILLKLVYVRVLPNTWEEEIYWCLQNFKGHDSVAVINRLVLNAFIYHIWRERNNIIFRSSFNSQDQVSLLIVQDVRFKVSAINCKEEDNSNVRWFMSRWRIDCLFFQPDTIECTWLAPATDETMTNTDGSMSDDAGSFGAILRDHTAEVISAASGSSPPISVLAHEIQGVELGLKMALKFDKLKIHIASDSMVVYNLLTNPTSEPPWNVLQIGRRIKHLRRKFVSWKVTHCYRETNRAADHLAGKYLSDTWLEKERDRHLLSCPAGDGAITPFEAQISALDNEKAQLEHTLNFVLADHRLIITMQLQKKLNDVMGEKQRLDDELNGMEAQFEVELDLNVFYGGKR